MQKPHPLDHFDKWIVERTSCVLSSQNRKIAEEAFMAGKIIKLTTTDPNFAEMGIIEPK